MSAERELMYEDELPADMTDEEYERWFADSAVVDGVRMGPKIDPQIRRQHGETSEV
jgi:hypothetical protein